MSTAVQEEKAFVPASASTRPLLLEARNLTCAFGEGEDRVKAIDNVSLIIRSGEFTLILGPSGSGKSTLLATLAGLNKPTSGTVQFLGRDLYSLSAREIEEFRRRHCGFIFQDYALLPALNARQQLELVLRWGAGVAAGEARERALQMLAEVGLARKTSLLPSELSGGEKQRVAVARGLVKNPTFCFADEPTGALDWGNGEQVIRLLRDACQRRGLAALVATHDERLLPYADRVFMMEDGRLMESRSPLDAQGVMAPETLSLDRTRMPAKSA